MSRILVVDDEPGILRVIQLTLEDYGHEVVSTGDPKTVLRLVGEERPDAVILDVMMPEISGWELLEAIRKNARTEHLPVIMLSALGEVEHRVRGLRQGADDYVKKPFDPEELVARVEGVISRKPAPGSGLEGSLEIQSFTELIQSLDHGSKSGSLRVVSGKLVGEVVLLSGRLVRARLGGLKGKQAILSLAELTAGRFSFESDSAVALDASKAADWPEPQRVQPLLLEAAWLRDNLEIFAQSLPPEDLLLSWKGPVPQLPEQLDGLPFSDVIARLGEGCASLAELVAEIPLTANSVRLSVAWLCREGAIEGLPEGDPQPEISESLDAVMRDFLQTAVFRGFSLDAGSPRGVRIAILAAESTWDSLASLLLSLPESLLARRDRQRRRDVFLGRGGSLPLSHSAGSLVLEFRQLGKGKSQLAGLGFLGGVIFPGAAEETSWRGVAEELARDGATILVASQEEGRKGIENALADLPHWQHLEEPVTDLEGILAALSLVEPQ